MHCTTVRFVELYVCARKCKPTLLFYKCNQKQQHEQWVLIFISAVRTIMCFVTYCCVLIRTLEIFSTDIHLQSSKTTELILLSQIYWLCNTYFQAWKCDMIIMWWKKNRDFDLLISMRCITKILTIFFSHFRRMERFLDIWSKQCGVTWAAYSLRRFSVCCWSMLCVGLHLLWFGSRSF